MTEEKKDEEKEDEKKKDEDKKDGEKKGKKDEGKIIMQTAICCEECRYKVYRAVIGYPGVEDVSIDSKENKVTLKAPKVDVKKLFEAAKKNSKGTITKLIFPDPKDIKQPAKSNKKPVEVTVVLKLDMNCSACIRKVEKAAWSLKDIQSVKVAGDIVTVKGLDLDPQKVCKAIRERSGKHAEIVPPKKDDKKGGDKKGGEKKDEEKNGEKKDGEKKDGEKKEGEKKDGKKDDKPPPQVAAIQIFAPQYFSEENPNACALM